MADLTPLTLVTGLPGSGKTLFVLTIVEEYALRTKRQVYYHGIPELTRDWILLDDPKTWHKLPNGSIIVIDESQSTFPPRSSSSAMPAHVSPANTLRHKGFNLVVMTQHPMLIDGSIRKLVTCHYHVVRFYGFQKSTVHEFQQVRDNCDKSLKGSIANHFVYPSEVFNWYKSADMHTIKKRIPARLILIVVLPIVVVLLVVFFIKLMGRLNHSSVLSASGSVVSSTSGGQSISPVPHLTYVQRFKPRVKGLAFTAPVYDNVTVTVSAPYPSACVDFNGHCRCYSQQSTRLLMPDSLCRSIIKNGFFNYFKPVINNRNDNNKSMTSL